MDIFVGPVDSVAPADGRTVRPKHGAPVWSVDYRKLWSTLRDILLPNVSYVTVSAHDFGIGAGLFDSTEFPNILVLSGGGFGHIPIPLLKADYFATSPDPRPSQFFAIFTGSLSTNPKRKMWLRVFSDALVAQGLPSLKLYGGGGSWKDVVAAADFCICPRGRGRSAFALAEALLFGCVPVYIYDDDEWLPYRGAPRGDWSMLGLQVRATDAIHIDAVVEEMKYLRQSRKIHKMRRNARKLARTHFSHSGLASQISSLLQGHTNCSLRCRKPPFTTSADGPLKVVVTKR